jgi:hypothetical protein
MDAFSTRMSSHRFGGTGRVAQRTVMAAEQQ